MNAHFTSVAMIIVLSACDSGTDAANEQANVYENTHKCDEVAAHPDDPGKWASGVSDDELIPGVAIKHCTDAVLEHPKTPRFHFQLGRALLKANKYQESIDAFADAAGSDYAPAFAYLADFYSSGALGEPDMEKAVTYYQLAADGGFYPAEQSLNSMNAEGDAAIRFDSPDSSTSMITGEEQTSHNEALFDPSPFSKGQILSNLYHGDFEALNAEEQFGVTLYLSWVHNYFAEPDNLLDDSCSAVADPRVSKAIHSRGMDNIGLGLSPSGLDNVARVGLELYQGGIGVMMGSIQDLEVTINSGKTDASRLRRIYGCESPVFKRLYSNLVSYILGKEPIMSPEVAKRLKLKKYSLAAKSSCLAQYDDTQFCECMTGELQSLELSDDPWERVSANFVSLASLTDSQEELRSAVRNCISGL